MVAIRHVKGFWPILIGLAILAVLFLPTSDYRYIEAQAAGCWQAAITDQQSNLDLIGSVLRVSVQGKYGLPVTIRSRGSYQSVGYTGTKPEYGPFVAEFAPLSRGTYFIEPQDLGIVYEIWLDGKNYTRVDFTSSACPPTATPLPTATARPAVKSTAVPAARPGTTARPTASPIAPQQGVQPASGWQSRIVKEIRGQPGVFYATIAVRVTGRASGQRVEARADGWSDVQTTGTKPEFGPDACEFGALNAGTYTVIPVGLGARLDVPVKNGDFVEIEFYQAGPTATTRWVGSIANNTSGSQPTEFVDSAISIVVAGLPWHQVAIQAGDYHATCTTGTKPDYGPDACEFGGLRAGTYTITPKDLDASVQVTVDGRGWAMVRFERVTVPSSNPTALPAKPTAQPTQPGPAKASATPVASPVPSAARWKGWVVSNSSNEGEDHGISSVIVVRVLNTPGIPVSITGGGGWSATCTTGTKPEYGPAACEFGGLWPSTYFLQPQGSDATVEVTMDGRGIAFVNFTTP